MGPLPTASRWALFSRRLPPARLRLSVKKLCPLLVPVDGMTVNDHRGAYIHLLCPSKPPAPWQQLGMSECSTGIRTLLHPYLVTREVGRAVLPEALAFGDPNMDRKSPRGRRSPCMEREFKVHSCNTHTHTLDHTAFQADSQFQTFDNITRCIFKYWSDCLVSPVPRKGGAHFIRMASEPWRPGNHWKQLDRLWPALARTWKIWLTRIIHCDHLKSTPIHNYE